MVFERQLSFVGNKTAGLPEVDLIFSENVLTMVVGNDRCYPAQNNIIGV